MNQAVKGFTASTLVFLGKFRKASDSLIHLFKMRKNELTYHWAYKNVIVSSNK